jgi:predicted Zn-dependent protease
MSIRIEILDGTNEAKWGNAAKRSLENLANAMDQRIFVPSHIGKADLPGFKVVKKLVEYNWNESREQVNLDGIQNDIARTSFRNIQDPNITTLIFFEEDLYGSNLNWCYGRSASGLIMVSTKRINKEIGRDGTYAFQELLSHELGHQFGAAPRSRRLTEENLGSHCLVDLCGMQQKTSIKSSEAYLRRRFRANAGPYCNMCVDDLKKYSR